MLNSAEIPRIATGASTVADRAAAPPFALGSKPGGTAVSSAASSRRRASIRPIHSRSSAGIRPSAVVRSARARALEVGSRLPASRGSRPTIDALPYSGVRVTARIARSAWALLGNLIGKGSLIVRAAGAPYGGRQRSFG